MSNIFIRRRFRIATQALRLVEEHIEAMRRLVVFKRDTPREPEWLKRIFNDAELYEFSCLVNVQTEALNAFYLAGRTNEDDAVARIRAHHHQHSEICPGMEHIIHALRLAARMLQEVIAHCEKAEDDFIEMLRTAVGVNWVIESLESCFDANGPGAVEIELDDLLVLADSAVFVTRN